MKVVPGGAERRVNNSPSCHTPGTDESGRFEPQKAPAEAYAVNHGIEAASLLLRHEDRAHEDRARSWSCITWGFDPSEMNGRVWGRPKDASETWESGSDKGAITLLKSRLVHWQSLTVERAVLTEDISTRIVTTAGGYRVARVNGAGD